MSAAAIIERAAEDGVLLALSPSGRISAKGAQSAIDRWVPVIRQSKAEIILLLRPGGDGWSALDWQHFLGERAKIAECGGQSRAEAEASAFAWCLAEWLNRNPMLSPPGRCLRCGGEGYDGSPNPLLPFGIGNAGEVWLHSSCGPAWYAGRKAEAIAALAEMGVVAPANLPDEFGDSLSAAESTDQPDINSVSSLIEADSGGEEEPRPSADPARPSVNDTDAVDAVGSVDDLEERAALIEEGAGVPRAWAEGYAALCTMPPPTGFSLGRWQRAVDAAGAFLDRWADTAIACGWTDLDVFGCDSDRPAARFDCMGLVLLLDRREVVAVDEQGADLVTNGGATQRFRRHPLPPGTVSLWELAR